MSKQPNLLLKDDKSHANSERLTATMAWPTDPSRINNLTTASVQNFIDEYDTDRQPTIFNDFQRQLNKAIWPGHVTGVVFIGILTGLTLGKSQFLAAETMHEMFFRGRKRSLKQNSVRHHWRRYKNAAHLWAAFNILDKLNEPKDPHELVQIANYFLKLAENSTKIPDWHPLIIESEAPAMKFEIDIPPLSKEAEEILQDYVPHSHL